MKSSAQPSASAALSSAASPEALPIAASTRNEAEIAKFSAIAAEWWDESGKFAPLHRINPVRIGYIRDQALAHFKHDNAQTITPLNSLSLLDIGCGGGLVAEPMARMGATVTAIDGSEKNIATASVHAEQSGLTIDYRVATAEELINTHSPTETLQPEQVRGGEAVRGIAPQQKNNQYDIVLALEVIEHVDNVPLFLESIAALVKPGGMLVMSTLNRTHKAYLMAILGAEYVLRWLPRGTHDWKKFLKPHELIQPLEQQGLTLMDMQGLVLNPLNWQWQLNPRDLDVNYMMVMTK